MSSTSSTQGQAERLTHSYEGALYVLPADKEERQRLTIQYQLFTSVLANRLVLPPGLSLSGNDEVLDVGTGTAAWISDLRSRVPKSVQLYGIDIEPRMFSSHIASFGPSVHLSVCSGLELPSEWTSKFTLVNQRLLLLGYSKEQWKRAIEEIYRVTVPGGFVQFTEAGPNWISGPKTASQMVFWDDFLGRKGMIFRIAVYIADMLREVGFTDVKVEEGRMKLGKWAGDEGIKGRDIIGNGWGSVCGVVMNEGENGRFTSAEEFRKTIDEIKEEWDNIEGSYMAVTSFYAQKPL